MPDVSSIGHGSVGPIDRAATPASAPSERHGRNGVAEPRSTDRVELSDIARFKDRLRELPDVRVDRVEQIRQAIVDGSYESEAKLDVAIQRLLEDLA